MYVVVKPQAQQGTAQRNHPCTKQETKYVPMRVRIERCTCMHAVSRLFSWGMGLLAFASRLFAPKMLDHLLTTYICLLF